MSACYLQPVYCPKCEWSQVLLSTCFARNWDCPVCHTKTESDDRKRTNRRLICCECGWKANIRAVESNIKDEVKCPSCNIIARDQTKEELGREEHMSTISIISVVSLLSSFPLLIINLYLGLIGLFMFTVFIV